MLRSGPFFGGLEQGVASACQQLFECIAVFKALRFVSAPLKSGILTGIGVGIDGVPAVLYSYFLDRVKGEPLHMEPVNHP